MFVFSITGASYLFLSLVSLLWIFRIFQFWRKENTIVSRLLLLYLIFFQIFCLITTLGVFFFAKNSGVLKLIVVNASFAQGLMSAVLGYLIFHLKFPKISPWLGFFIVFSIGFAGAVLSFLKISNPQLEGISVNWDIVPIADILRFLTIMISILPMGIILIQEGKGAKDPKIKNRSYGLAFLFFAGLVAAATGFFLEKYLRFGAISSDISIFFLGLSLLIIFLITQKRQSDIYLKEINGEFKY
ncbi:MAG: hypothetical protein PHF44_00145 [Candidatus Pacebacteria bacterium]|nr:hypothetical protein [Candidatus Paceibacterota bacterium]